jgi:hypothetical protein
MIWDWQVDAALNGWYGWQRREEQTNEYFAQWNREHPEAHARIVAKYRRTHREKTLAQWAADTKRYEARVGREVIRERNRIAVRKYQKKRRAMLKAERELKAREAAERNLLSVESDNKRGESE